MIFSTLDNWPTIRFLSSTPVFRQAFEWIKANVPATPDGITALAAPDFYVNVHRYDTKPRSACFWESHRQTVDLQLCITGGELIDWTSLQPTTPSTSFTPEKDADIWPAEIPAGQTLAFRPGTFAVFLPGELHRPAIADGQHPGTRKLVVKIPARLLTS